MAGTKVVVHVLAMLGGIGTRKKVSMVMKFNTTMSEFLRGNITTKIEEELLKYNPGKTVLYISSISVLGTYYEND